VALAALPLALNGLAYLSLSCFATSSLGAARFYPKHWPDVPIAHDVKELANDPARLVPDCDILTAGYPCQPFSVAGKQRGKEDPRHIYLHISQIIARKRPAFVVLENVLGIFPLDLMRYSMIWRIRTTPLGRSYFQAVRLSERPTTETESSSLQEMWATPNTMDHLPQRSAESTEKMKQGARKGRARPSNLREQVNPDTMQMWATPRTTDGTAGPRKLNEKGRRISQTNPNLDYGANLSDQVKMWPTPTANEDACGTPNGKMQRMLGSGTLNPEFVTG
jgi:hypothetical protein